jgi:hypothetical protein
MNATYVVRALPQGKRRLRCSRGHAWDALVRNMPPACVCSAGDGDGKINCNTACRDNSGVRHDVGGVHGNPRFLKNAGPTIDNSGRVREHPTAACHNAPSSSARITDAYSTHWAALF